MARVRWCWGRCMGRYGELDSLSECWNARDVRNCTSFSHAQVVSWCIRILPDATSSLQIHTYNRVIFHHPDIGHLIPCHPSIHTYSSSPRLGYSLTPISPPIPSHHRQDQKEEAIPSPSPTSNPSQPQHKPQLNPITIQKQKVRPRTLLTPRIRIPRSTPPDPLRIRLRQQNVAQTPQ